MKLGLKIKALRNEKKESQEVFSDNIGINRGTLASIELCKQNPTIETLKRIAVNYNISLDGLILDDNETIPKTIPKTIPNDENVSILSEPLSNYNSESGIPLIPIEAMAGFGSGDTQVFKNQIQERLVIPESEVLCVSDNKD